MTYRPCRVVLSIHHTLNRFDVLYAQPHQQLSEPRIHRRILTMSAAPVSAVGSTEHDVYPTHILDDAKGARNLAMGWLFRIDAPLDVGVLCDGLRRVLQVGDWRKLAGTLHFTASLASDTILLRPAAQSQLTWPP